MPRSGRSRIFEELGAFDEEEQAPNPFEALGLDVGYVDGLLGEDTSGAAVKALATAIFRTHARRYHPDVPGTGDRDRYTTIKEAHDRVSEGSLAALTRWVREKGQGAPVGEVRRVRDRQEQVLQMSSDLLQSGLELGRHPQHFSRLDWAQGALLQRGSTSILLRQLPGEGVEVRPAQQYDMGVLARFHNQQALDFTAFMKHNRSFGLKPGMEIATYIDEEGRASILSADLGFLMDITHPVAKYRDMRNKVARSQAQEEFIDFWSGSGEDPLLFTTRVAKRGESPELRVMTFPEYAGPKKTADNRTARHFPMEVVGTVADAELYRKVRHARSEDARALAGGGGTPLSAGSFNFASVTARQLVERNAGYSPLLGRGKTLLLFDAQSRTPVVTDARVVGMIGSGSTAP